MFICMEIDFQKMIQNLETLQTAAARGGAGGSALTSTTDGGVRDHRNR